MHELLRRTFIVDVPLDIAWAHFARVAAWPSWAKHIKRIDVQPDGAVTTQSQGTIHLANGMTSTFKMAEFNPPHNWLWVGSFLWMTVHYDHRFEAISDAQTHMTFIVYGDGVGSSVIGRLFAWVYGRNLDKVIPNLITEMKNLAGK